MPHLSLTCEPAFTWAKRWQGCDWLSSMPVCIKITGL